MSDYKTSDYCAVCGESPDSGSHLPHGHAYVPPLYPEELVDRVSFKLAAARSLSADDWRGAREVAREIIAEVRRLPAPAIRFGDQDGFAKLGDMAREYAGAPGHAFGLGTPTRTRDNLRAAGMVYAADELDRFGAPASAQLARDIAAALAKED